MIDYFTHIAVLKRINSALATESINEPAVAAARDKVIADVALDEDAAYLGACIDHVISHADLPGCV